MKKLIDDKRLMIKACDLYYNENKTQQQIAEILGISHPTVSHLLSGAIKEKVLNITINDLDSIRYWETEQKIKKRFNLRDVIVVSTGTEPGGIKRSLGAAALKYLESIMAPGDMVGISMGSTLHSMCDSAALKTIKNITFVPLVGGMGRLRTELHSNHLAEMLAKKYRGSYLPLYAPARVSNKIVRKKLESEQSVSEVLAMYKGLSAVVVGIGYPNEASSIMATGYYKENEIQSLLERGVVGELCMQFYDISGDTSLYKKDNTVIGVNISHLRRLPFSIGVAGGTDKITAIIGAINGGFINTLICDSMCAEEILKRCGER